jgi:hypothetical protein
MYVVAYSPTVPTVQAQDVQLNNIRDEFFNGEFEHLVSTFPSLPADLRDNPLVYFWVGQSYLRLHDIEHAQEFLLKAENNNLPQAQHERAQQALRRINTLKQLRPPFYHDYKLDGFAIRIFARDSPWTKNLTQQMPTFLNRAKEAFGSSNAYIAFYLFEDRSSYDKFFESWTLEPQGSQHRGTGGTHIVMFCRYYPTGKQVGENDIDDLYFRVLHEYSHALCNTIYGDKFNMPQWLNEGMADYFGWKYKAKGVEEARQRLQRLASQKPARTYDDVTARFHDDTDTGYAIGDVMASELFQGKRLSIFSQIISSARSSGGNFDMALQQTTGRDPRAMYAQLVKTYWKTR